MKGRTLEPSGSRSCFEAADRNKDGFVTEEELTKEIRLRALLNGFLTNEQMLTALLSGLQPGAEDHPSSGRK